MAVNPQLIKENEVSNPNEFKEFKIIIIGDSGVGKSSIIKRACKNKFDENYQATVGFEFLTQYYIVNEAKIKLQLWDTCGQEMYRSLVQGFYRNTSLAVIVYDIIRKETFESLDTWINDIRSRHEQEVPIFIVGNKEDLENDRKISFKEAQDFSKSRSAKFFIECSAKTAKNVDNIFYEVAKYIYNDKDLLKGKNSSNKLKIGNNDEEITKKKKGCC